MRERSSDWVMERPLLARFLAHDDTRCLRGLILASIADLRSDSPLVRKEFTFNDFDLDLDVAEGTAVLRDIIVDSESSVVRMQFEAFEAAFEAASDATTGTALVPEAPASGRSVDPDRLVAARRPG
jgi:hypothetical protein